MAKSPGREIRVSQSKSSVLDAQMLVHLFTSLIVSFFFPSFQPCSLLSYRTVKYLWLAQGFSAWEARGLPPGEGPGEIQVCLDNVLLEYEELGRQTRNLLLKRMTWMIVLRKLITKTRVYSLEGPLGDGCPDPGLEWYASLDVVTCQGKQKRN